MLLGRVVLATLFAACLVAGESKARTPEEDAAFRVGVQVMNEMTYHLGRVSDSTVTTVNVKIDPIAAALNECLLQVGHTHNGDCYEGAHKSYDLLLSQIYQLALDENDEKSGNALRLSQRQWLAFQKADEVARLEYWQQEDRAAPVVGWASGNQRMSAVRERIAEIMFYLGADQE